MSSIFSLFLQFAESICMQSSLPQIANAWSIYCDHIMEFICSTPLWSINKKWTKDEISTHNFCSSNHILYFLLVPKTAGMSAACLAILLIFWIAPNQIQQENFNNISFKVINVNSRREFLHTTQFECTILMDLKSIPGTLCTVHIFISKT